MDRGLVLRGRRVEVGSLSPTYSLGLPATYLRSGFSFTVCTVGLVTYQLEGRVKTHALECPSSFKTQTRILLVMDVCIQVSMNVPFKKKTKREGRGSWETVRGVCSQVKSALN